MAFSSGPALAGGFTSSVLSKMRTLIVDDEPIARKVLREELEVVDSVEIIGEADSAEGALAQITSLKPDLVFLDIEMPIMGGFELLGHLKGGFLPVFVMVTAYDEHAIRAFEAGAIDYVLKPISQQRLLQAIERAKRLWRSPLQSAETVAYLQTLARADAAERSQPSVRKIIGKLGDEYFLLKPDEVLAFQAEGDITWIMTARQRYIATQNLRSIEERLQHSAFRRIHRNALVNIDQIRKMSMITSQRWLITLNNGHEFVVSKRQARNIRDVLHW
jgi:two-component system, LytTR family, response regulator